MDINPYSDAPHVIARLGVPRIPEQVSLWYGMFRAEQPLMTWRKRSQPEQNGKTT